MLAFGLSLLVFFVLTAMGYSLIPKKFIDFDRSFALFISPAIGLAFSILFIFTFNRLGFPVKEIKIPFIFYFLIISGVGIYRNTISNLSKQTLIKFSLAPLGILFTAWPILKYGFSWISYVNDDMNNYVLGATRFYNYGFFTKPNSALYSGSDYSQIYYFFHVLGAVRPGSELYLSAFSNLRGGNALEIFMPAILTLQLILLFSTLAMSRTLLKSSKRKTRLAYILSVLLPLSSLGFLYQLIGQVGGLAIGVAVIAVSAILFRQDNYNGFRPVFYILAFLMASQLIWYPELLPFVALPLIIRVIFARRIQRKILWIGTSFVSVFAILVLNRYFFQAVKFGATQIVGAQKSTFGVNANAQLFPYFLKPHGLPSYLGISPLNRWSHEPWESITVILSIVILVILGYVLISKRLFKEFPVALFLMIFGVFIYLVTKGNGFGAFKIAMYVEPFFIITICGAINYPSFRYSKKRTLYVIGLFLSLGFCSFAARTAEFYANASTGNSSNGFNEIQGGSGAGILNEIAKSLKDYRTQDGAIVSTALNLSQIKLEAIAAKGIPLVFPTTDVFANFLSATHLGDSLISRQFQTFKSESSTNIFEQPVPIGSHSESSRWYLESNNKYEAINHSKIDVNAPTWNYKLVKNPSNTLIFISSSQGPVYYNWNSEREKAVIFQPEQDPMLPGTYMQGIGDNLLFELVNPSPNPYFVLNASTTLLSQYDRLIPKVSIWGMSQSGLPTVGRGSIRAYVPLVPTVSINGHKYFQLHIDQSLAPLISRLSGISRLYGSNIRVDSRRIAMFASNVSVIDRSEILHLNAPTALSSFPGGLQNANLYYSGIYEDGWISSDSFFNLRSVGKSNFLVAGLVPNIKGLPQIHEELTISIDGVIVNSSRLPPGQFHIIFPVANLNKRVSVHHVSLHFSNDQILPQPDGRPAAAQVTYLGFQAAK